MATKREKNFLCFDEELTALCEEIYTSIGAWKLEIYHFFQINIKFFLRFPANFLPWFCHMKTWASFGYEFSTQKAGSGTASTTLQYLYIFL
jgi:hypothetical protein